MNELLIKDKIKIDLLSKFIESFQKKIGEKYKINIIKIDDKLHYKLSLNDLTHISNIEMSSLVFNIYKNNNKYCAYIDSIQTTFIYRNYGIGTILHCILINICVNLELEYIFVEAISKYSEYIYKNLNFNNNKLLAIKYPILTERIKRINKTKDTLVNLKKEEKIKKHYTSIRPINKCGRNWYIGKSLDIMNISSSIVPYKYCYTKSNFIIIDENKNEYDTITLQYTHRLNLKNILIIESNNTLCDLKCKSLIEKLHSSGGNYYHKYLKYKMKYLQLKNNL
jgi:hypothetical protein